MLASKFERSESNAVASMGQGRIAGNLFAHPQSTSYFRRKSWLETSGWCDSETDMSTVADIEQAIENLTPEQWLEIRRWMDRRAPVPVSAVTPMRPLPNFLARQKAVFGERVLEDSQTILDKLRADRQ